MARTQKARVEVGRAVGGGVDVSFGSKIARMRTELSGGVFSVDPQTGILFTDASGWMTVVAPP
jgi:hypothetical protein